MDDGVFRREGSPPTGTAWTLVNGLALAAMAGFTVAGWAVFKAYSWWPMVALLSAVVGLIAVVPFVVGLRQIRVALTDPGVQINLWLHLLGSAVVVAMTLVPAARGGWCTGCDRCQLIVRGGVAADPRRGALPAAVDDAVFVPAPRTCLDHSGRRHR